MDIERLFLICCGYEDSGDQFRLYLEGPNPQPSCNRDHGQRTNLFYLFDREEAEAIRHLLANRKVWQVLRVPPPYTEERGIAALRIARSWSSGPGSPIHEFANTRRMRGEDHRRELRREV